MAGEFSHKDIGNELTKTEWEATDTHEADGETANDMLYFNGTYWIRAAKATILALLALGNVENTAHSTDTHTMAIDGRDVSVDGTKLDGIAAGANAGADKALSNLASVAVNTSLISDTDNTDDLGSAAKEWKDVYVDGTAYIDNIEIASGETITGDGTDLTIASGAKIKLTATSDVVIPVNVGLHLGDGAEKLESDNANLTINSGGELRLTATSDVVLPVNIGLHLGDGTSKLESNDTDLTINAGGDIALTATNDINVPASVGMTFGNDGEKIEGDGTDMTIASSGALTLTGATVIDVAAGDINITGETAGTDDIQTLLRLDRTSSGTTDDGFGLAIEFHLENDNGDLHEMAKLECNTIDVSQGTEDSRLKISTYFAGTLREVTDFNTYSSRFTRWLTTTASSAQATAYFIIQHADASGGQAGEAVSFIGQLPDSAGNTDFVARVNFGWTVATSASEVGFCALTARSVGDTYATNEVLRLSGEHNMGLDVTSWGTNANTVFAIANGTAPDDSIANGVQIYSEDVSTSAELFCRDEAGNAVQLTPHPTDVLDTLPIDVDHEYPYVYIARNDYLGKEIWVDMELLAKEVERLSGKSLVHLSDIPKQDWSENQERIREEREERIKQVQENIDTYTELKKNAPSEKKAKDYQEIIDQLLYVFPEPYKKKSIPQWIAKRVK